MSRSARPASASANSCVSLTQARTIAGAWRAARRAGHDPVMEWEARLAEERSTETARTAAIAAEAAQPTVRDVVLQFMAKHMAGKKSAPSIGYPWRAISTSALGTECGLF